MEGHVQAPPRSKSLRASPAVVVLVLGMAIVLIVVALRLAPTSSATVGAVTPAPLGDRKYLVFMADGILPSPAALLGDGDAFQRDVMKRTPAQVAADKGEAITFFRQRFGVDFSAGDSIDGVTLTPFAVPSAINYRAYTISGESVPAVGWQVHDGGWVGIVGPGGATLHGAWGGTDGRWVPEGTSVPFGNYVVDVEGPKNAHRDPIVLHYQGFIPVLPMVGSTPMFDCELTSPAFGHGQALGVYDLRTRVDGTVHMMVRNVLTFA
jgi:hypothetical protein